MTRSSTPINRETGATGQRGCMVVQTTPDQPGAIAILQLIGDVTGVLRELTGINDWPIGRARLARLADIDEGLAARVSENVAQLMPHGGLRVVQRLMDRLIALGVQPTSAMDVDPQSLYPEAADRFEALALAAIARAASPLAIDLLLDQPRRWRSLLPSPLGRGVGGEGVPINNEDRARSLRLNRLIDPPMVVLAGAANVGKSTLSNALLGRSMSIAADLPGTTRDYTSARIDLAGLVVQWHDTPGLRSTDDPIETKAIDLARRLIERADLVIAMTDHEHDWPALLRQPDLKVASKCDLARRDDADLCVSAVTGEGMRALVTSVRDRLVPPEDLAHPGPWLFDERIV